MPVPRCKLQKRRGASTVSKQGCDVLRLPEPFVNLCDEAFAVGWLVMCTMAKKRALGNEVQQEQL